MERVVVFLDYANLNASARSLRCEIDHGQLLNYLADQDEGRFLQAAFAYVPKDPRQEHAQDRVIDDLWSKGYVVKSKVGTIAGQSYKCDFDVEITLDIAKAAYEIKPDVVVLISGDSDFIPVVLDLRNKGIRVEIASFGCSMSGLLSNRCSGFINLDILLDEAQQAPIDNSEEPDSEEEPVQAEVEYEVIDADETDR